MRNRRQWTSCGGFLKQINTGLSLTRDLFVTAPYFSPPLTRRAKPRDGFIVQFILHHDFTSRQPAPGEAVHFSYDSQSAHLLGVSTTTNAHGVGRKVFFFYE